jgi:hypothetical protein
MGWDKDYLVSRENNFVSVKNISVISWLLSRIVQLYCSSQFYWWRKPDNSHRENHQLAASYGQSLSHKVVSSTQSLSINLTTVLLHSF